MTTVIFSKNKDESEAKFTLVHPPDSRCSCIPGLGFCSHLYGFMLLLMIIQMTTEDAAEFFTIILPENTDDITTEFLDIHTILSFQRQNDVKIKKKY